MIMNIKQPCIAHDYLTGGGDLTDGGLWNLIVAHSDMYSNRMHWSNEQERTDKHLELEWMSDNLPSLFQIIFFKSQDVLVLKQTGSVKHFVAIICSI